MATLGDSMNIKRMTGEVKKGKEISWERQMSFYASNHSLILIRLETVVVKQSINTS
jgi:hypothetical protein